MTGNRSDIGYAKINFFYHPDHLGSTSMVTDAEGNITQHVAYIPYGEVFVEERNGVWNTPYLFNAKELDEETGMYYYGARYLNPKDTRWLSVDPLWEKNIAASPYNYCHGNPIIMVDPDGMWEQDADGNLIAQKGDNAWTLAKYLNTSSYLATEMLKEQGYSVNKKGVLNLKVGDKFNVEHHSPKNENRKDFGFLGNQMRDHAHSEYSKNAFENYWEGKGDVEMSSERFAGILLYIKDNVELDDKKTTPSIVKSSDGNTMSANRRNVSFYGSYEYDFIFGTATVYINSKGAIVGFYDNYDFDSKKWGERTLKNEIVTRAVNLFSPKNAKSFSIRYGFSNR